MPSNRLIESIELECPICNKVHKVEKRQRKSQSIIKGEVVDYHEIYFLCTQSIDEENEFVSAEVMDVNLLEARDAYRRMKSLLTSDEIIGIRKSYGFTQNEFSNLLGWGEVTVTRYESKTIQDQTYDRVMKYTMENPLFALECLEENQDKFSESRYISIRGSINEKIAEVGSFYFTKQQIFSQYIMFNEPNEYNGYKTLDLDKLANVMGYYAQYVNDLSKVKLMKLLWYTDVLFYTRFNVSMTGLVYKHMSLGALPLASVEIINLRTIDTVEELINQDVVYRVVPKQEILLSSFTFDELSVLQLICRTFLDYTNKEIISYMLDEKVFKETELNEVISYDVASGLKYLK